MKLDLLLCALDEWALPRDDYAITTSGALAARGIREARDLDLIVTPRLWRALAARYPAADGLIRLGEHVEVLGPDSPVSVAAESQIARAETIDDHPFALLEDVRDAKARLSRPRDVADLALIDAFVERLTGESGALAPRQTGIRGIAYRVANGVMHLHSERPIRCLSSAPCGGGTRTVRDVLNVHVSRDYRSESPEANLQAIARDLGIESDFVGLLTAVYVERTVAATRRDGDLVVACVATAGVGNATSACREVPWRPETTDASPAPGTINVVLLAEANLAPEAIVNLVITATEAKTLALIDLGVRTVAGEVATGTSTDAIVVGCTGTGEPRRYAGPATLVGHLAAQCVHEAVTLSLRSPGSAAPAPSPLGAR